MSEVVGSSLLVPTAASGGGSNTITGDEYFANVLLLLHCEGDYPASTTTFGDSSTYNRTVTNVGAATTSVTQVKFGLTSGSFNGTTQYLTVADSADWDMAGDFTWEGWTYITQVVGTINPLLTFNGTLWEFCRDTSGFLTFNCSPNSPISGTTVVTSNAWHHLAAVRISGVVYTYLDGVLQASGSAADSITPTGVEIGGYNSGVHKLTGYIDEVRITKGVGRYTGAFPPPTAAFPNNLPITYGIVASSQDMTGVWTYINSVRRNENGTPSTPYSLPATSLTSGNHIFVWINCDSFTAGSVSSGTHVTDTAGNTYKKVFYSYGNAVYGYWVYCLNAIGHPNNVVTFTPAVGGLANCYGMLSMQFSKTGGAATLDMSSHSSNTTVTTTVSGAPMNTNMGGLILFGTANSAGLDTSVTWSNYSGTLYSPIANDGNNRVAAVYALPAAAQTGVSITATGSAGTVGRMVGQLSITEPLTSSYDPYFSNVVLLLHGDGTNGSTSVVDSSAYNRTMTASNVTLSNTQSKFGGTSMRSGGITSFVRTPLSTDFWFSGDFTIEFWVYFVANSATSQLFMSNKGSWTISGYIYLSDLANSVLMSAAPPAGTIASAGSWHHIAMCRAGFFLDGVMKVAASPTSIANGSAGGGLDQYWFVGGDPASFPNQAMLAGNFVDEVRITKGVTRYAGDFTPPTFPFASVSTPSTSPSLGTVLLLHGNGPNGSTTIVDSSASSHTFTSVNAINSTAQSKFGGGSIALPYNGYITTPASSDFNLMGTALSCTIECWMYPVARGTGNQFMYGGLNWSLYLSAAGLVSLNIAATSGSIVTAYGSTVLALNTWTHVAAVLNAGVMKVYIGGIGGTPATLSTYYDRGTPALVIGDTTGNLPNLYLDEVRIVKGTAVYTTNFVPPVSAFSNPASGGPSPGTVFLMHATPVGYAFTDSSAYAQTIVNYIGRAYIQVAAPSPPIGSYAIITPLVPVSGLTYNINSYLQVPYAAGGYRTFWDVLAPGGSGTIECYYYPAPASMPGYYGYTVGGAIFSWGGGALDSADTYNLVWRYPGVVTLTVAAGGGYLSYSATTTAPQSAWAHIALVNNAGVITLYINGIGTTIPLASPRTVVGMPTFNINIANISNWIPITYGSSLFCEFRVSSTAVYTANFTPPTSPLT